MLKIRWEIHIEKDGQGKDITVPKMLRIYQWIGEKIFHWGKWNEPIGNSAHTAEYLATRPWKYLFLAYVYKSLAFISEWTQETNSHFSQDFVDNSHFGWEINGLLDRYSQ